MFPEQRLPIPQRFVEPLEALGVIKLGIMRPWGYDELQEMDDDFYISLVEAASVIIDIQQQQQGGSGSISAPKSKASELGLDNISFAPR